MVNAKSTSRSAVLEFLRKTDGPASGARIGKQLGISRVAVRKHIIKLMNEGFLIESGKSGYLLRAEPDYPAPSDIESSTVHISEEVESTMDEASKRLDGPINDIQFFLARKQSAGRGRNKKAWISPEGGLYMTVSFRPRLPAAYIFLYLIHSGLSLSEALRNQYGVNCRFRWPNDLYVHESKLGGMLIEMSGPADSPDRALLGFGLNVRSRSEFSAVKDRTVTSLQDEIHKNHGEIPGTKDLFNKLKPVFESSLGSIDPVQVRESWRSLSDAVGTRIRIEGRLYTVRDLALNGSLLLADQDGVLFETAPGPIILGPV